ncbi:unnamed protein product [Closterium sp. Naga37s-1]|nr:unnamed protein product [Closterium sp. Naga37s-1]
MVARRADSTLLRLAAALQLRLLPRAQRPLPVPLTCTNARSFQLLQEVNAPSSVAHPLPLPLWRLNSSLPFPPSSLPSSPPLPPFPLPRPQPQAANERSFPLLQEYLAAAHITFKASQRFSNERSFQLLQEYLAAAHMKGAGSRASGMGAAAAAASGSRRSYEFEFFIREEISSSSSSTASSTSSTSSSGTVLFRHVTMALPPPQRPRVVGGSIPLRTRMALSQLLDACGLPPHLSNALASATAGFAGAGASEGGGMGGEGVRLSELLVEAAEIQRQCEAGWTDGAWNGGTSGGGSGGSGSSGSSTASSLVRDRAMMVHVLRMVRGVTVHIQPPASLSSSSAAAAAAAAAGAAGSGSASISSLSSSYAHNQQHQEVLLLEQLIKALDRNPDTDLSGSQVVIGSGGGGYGIDSQGRVWLPQGDDLSAWGDWLAGVDTSVVQRRRARARERRAKERAAACGMEVEMVFTDAGTAGLLVYEGFLERVIGHAEEHGAVCDGRLFELPVRVLGQAEGRIGGGGGGWGEGGGGEGGGGGDWLVDGGRLPTWSGDRFLHQHQTFSASFSSSSSASSSSSLSASSPSALRPADFSIDRRFGYAAVPVTATPTQLYTFLSQAGADAMAIRRLARDEEQRLDRLRTEVRQRLRLRRLVVDEGRITRDQGASGLLRLLRFAPQLMQLTEGLSLCVSNAHRLPMPQGVYDAGAGSALNLGGGGGGGGGRAGSAGEGGRAGGEGGVAGAGGRRGGSRGEQEWESSSVPFVHVKWNFSVSEL